MSQPSPLALPGPWNAVADAYEQDLVPWFELFANEALRLTAPPPEAVVLDVAAGPGTLSFVAAPRVKKVVAVDFATSMIERLRARAARDGVENVESHVMDGQALSFADATFDAAYSMFGVMFFPDRLKGMREMLRVLEPGAPAVITSWAPLEKCPIVAVAFGALSRALPEPPKPSAPPPLQDPAVFEGVLREAGFADARVDVFRFEQKVESADDYWDSFVRSSAPVVQLKANLGAEIWAGVEARARAAVKEALGPNGPWQLEGFANIGFGRKPV